MILFQAHSLDSITWAPVMLLRMGRAQVLCSSQTISAASFEPHCSGFHQEPNSTSVVSEGRSIIYA